jgi:uncharacterized protein (TIGR00730 family)
VRVAVFCGSSRRIPEQHRSLARDLGAEIARRGYTLVYGGCRTGSMGTLADGALAEGGRVIGVILQRFIDEDAHHPGLDELTSVEDLHERKTRLSEGADAFVVLPGGIGTLEELIDVLSLRKIGAHTKPVVLLDTDDFFAGMRAQLERGIAEDFDKPKVRGFIEVAKSPVDALVAIEALRDAQATVP